MKKTTKVYSKIVASSSRFSSLEAPSCNTDNFQLFLDEFSKENSTEFKVILLDNGPFRKTKDLTIPANMALLFIPPYAPELNPAEKI